MDGNHLGLIRDRTGPVSVCCMRIAGIAGCCLLVSLGAQVRIPVPGTDVPMTLQGLAVLLTGFALPAHWAAASMVLYLACGTAGIPVFSPGSAGVAGLTGGYLVGFVAAAWTVGWLRGVGGLGFLGYLAIATVGTAIIFCFGVAGRLFYFSGNWSLAVATGVVPFVWKAIIVTMLAATSAWSLRLLKRS